MGTLTAGLTVNDEPIQTHKSEAAASLYDFTNYYFFICYPKYMIESWSSPPQFSHYPSVLCIFFSYYVR